MENKTVGKFDDETPDTKQNPIRRTPALCPRCRMVTLHNERLLANVTECRTCGHHHHRPLRDEMQIDPSAAPSLINCPKCRMYTPHLDGKCMRLGHTERPAPRPRR